MTTYFVAGHLSISGCEPGWFKARKSCYLFSFKSTQRWRYARTFCHQSNADLAVAKDEVTVRALANQRREIKFDDRDLFLGLSSSTSHWYWLDGKNVSTVGSLWGPHEPSGDGKCGSFLHARSNPKWAGYGWRWNDLPCSTKIGYICEQPLGMP